MRLKILKHSIFILTFHLSIFTSNTVYAQNNEALTVDVSVPSIQRLIIENTKFFPAIGPDDINRGYIDLKDAVTLSVSSNVPWKVVAFTNRVNLYVSPGKFKSVENFQWRVSAKPFRSISQEPAIIMTGNGGTKDYKIELDYRLKLGWKDTPPGRWEFRPEFRIERDYEQIIRSKPKIESKIKKFPDKKGGFKKRHKK